MFEAGIESLGGGILSEAKHIAAFDARHAPGARDREEPQGPHAAKGRFHCGMAR
jgi:hypothetical protein